MRGGGTVFSQSRLAYILITTNAVIVGLSFLFTKVALTEAGPLDTLAFRFIAAFAAMSVPVALGWIKLHLRGKSLWRPLLLAAVYPLAFFTLQTFGLERATSAEGGILFAFAPVLTTLFASVLLREATTWLQKLSIAVSVSGVVTIFVAQGGGFDVTNVAGIGLLIASVIAIAAYNVLARLLLRDYRPLEVTYIMLAVGCVSFVTMSLAGHVATGTVGAWLAPLRSGPFVGAVLYLGVLSSAVTAFSANYALSQLEAGTVSIFSNLSTVVSIAAGVVFLRESVAAYHLIGSALIIAGVLGTAGLGRKTERLGGTGREEPKRPGRLERQ